MSPRPLAEVIRAWRSSKWAYAHLNSDKPTEDICADELEQWTAAWSAELKELSEKATPGPWSLAKDNYGCERIWDSEMDCDIASCEGDGSIEHETRKANGKFIVACVNSVREQILGAPKEG